MKKNIFTKLMTLALVGALLVPSVQTQAASKAATAKKALVAKAEKIAIADANKRSVIPIEYGLVDINGDKITEMVTAQGANTYTLTIYCYASKKVKKLATVKDAYAVYKDTKGKKIIVESGNSDTGAMAYTEYTMNKKGTKLVKKDAYTSTNSGRTFKKNGKKISSKAMEKYTQAVTKLKSVNLQTPASAQEIYDGNTAFNMLSGSVELLKGASVEVKLYSVEATDKGKEKKEVKSVTMEAGKTITDEAATIGIFNLNDPKLIEGEEYRSHSYVDENTYIMTTVPEKTVGTILPGFTLPEGTMEVIASYTVNRDGHLIDVDFTCNTGISGPFAEYTFTYKE